MHPNTAGAGGEEGAGAGGRARARNGRGGTERKRGGREQYPSSIWFITARCGSIQLNNNEPEKSVLDNGSIQLIYIEHMDKL